MPKNTPLEKKTVVDHTRDKTARTTTAEKFDLVKESQKHSETSFRKAIETIRDKAITYHEEITSLEDKLKTIQQSLYNHQLKTVRGQLKMAIDEKNLIRERVKLSEKLSSGKDPERKKTQEDIDKLNSYGNRFKLMQCILVDSMINNPDYINNKKVHHDYLYESENHVKQYHDLITQDLEKLIQSEDNMRHYIHFNEIHTGITFVRKEHVFQRLLPNAEIDLNTEKAMKEVHMETWAERLALFLPQNTMEDFFAEPAKPQAIQTDAEYHERFTALAHNPFIGRIRQGTYEFTLDSENGWYRFLDEHEGNRHTGRRARIP